MRITELKQPAGSLPLLHLSLSEADGRSQLEGLTDGDREEDRVSRCVKNITLAPPWLIHQTIEETNSQSGVEQKGRINWSFLHLKKRKDTFSSKHKYT